MNKSLMTSDEHALISEILLHDGVIAFPTDTVWGIGCLITSEKAINKIYELKGRDRSKPLIILTKDKKSVLPYIKNIPQKAEELIDKFLPGALTVVLDKSDNTPYSVTSNNETIGFRIPDHPVIIEILEKCVESHILVTTSANVSGEGAFSSKNDVIKSIGDKIEYTADDYGIVAKGKESTVLYVSSDNDIKIFRQGAVFID